MLRIALVSGGMLIMTACVSCVARAEDRTPRTAAEWRAYLEERKASDSGRKATPLTNRPTLGIYGRTYQAGNGYRSVQVTEVVQGSAATRLLLPPDAVTTYRLVPYRDYIAAVNGELVHSIEDLRRSIAASGRHCTMKVYDSRTRLYRVYYTELR